MRWILAFLVLGLLAACDSNEPGGGGQAAGTFTAQISGDLAKSFSGVASFGSVTGESEIFTLALSTTVGDMVSVARLGAGRPGTGTITILDVGAGVSSQAYWGTVVLLQEDVVFQSTSGTMQISTSSAQQLSGSLSFDAVTNDGREVVVSASFNAVCGIVASGSCD